MTPRLRSGLLAFLTLLGLGLGLIFLGGSAGEEARARELRAAAKPGARVLVLGNSVTQSAMEPVALAEGLGLPREAVVSLAVEGAGPWTWLAALRLAREAGAQPEVVLIYVPLAMIRAPEPPLQAELALLADLGAPPEAWALTGREGPDLLVEAQRRRLHLRERALQALTSGLVDLLWPTPPGARPASLRARMALFPDSGPNDAAASAPRAGGAEGRGAVKPRPEVAQALLSAAAAEGARLVVVQPAEHPEQRPQRCGEAAVEPELEQQLADGGADLIDLTTLFSTSDPFKTRHHLWPQWAPEASAAVAEALRALGLPGSAPPSRGRRWSRPCGGD